MAADANAVKTRNWSVHPVRVHGTDTVQYLQIRADEGVIGVGRFVSVWRQNEWRRARVVEPWTESSQGSMIWLDEAA
jgi:hypothetical protein